MGIKVVRTPLRISFAGGGSDLPEWFEEHEGAVVSATINKYVYVIANPRFESGVRVSYSETETVEDVKTLKHDIIRESLLFTGDTNHQEVVTIADIPGRGTGLGSSSALAVGMLKAFGKNTTHILASNAYIIERDWCNKPVGKQDHYSAAFGGINFFVFHKKHVGVVSMPDQFYLASLLNSHLVMFYTGITRPADEILSRQAAGYASKVVVMEAMVGLANQLRDDFQRGDISNLGRVLHEGWHLKRRLADGISSPEIDELYNRAMHYGAEGGKLLGAGGGGFLLFYVKPENRAKLIKTMPLKAMPFSVTLQGSQEV